MSQEQSGTSLSAMLTCTRELAVAISKYALTSIVFAAYRRPGGVGRGRDLLSQP
ncbi:MAG TPA: hypothetical protein VNY29_08270 [Terriglobales bacterium]|nr:hypothetical protein [Terriglobales bacterium]